MLVREDLRSTKNELLDEYSCHVIHRMSREIVKDERFQEILQCYLLVKVLFKCF